MTPISRLVSSERAQRLGFLGVFPRTERVCLHPGADPGSAARWPMGSCHIFPGTDPPEPLSPHSPACPQLLAPGGHFTRSSPFSARVFDFSFLRAVWGCISSCRELWVSFLGLFLLSRLLELLCPFPNPLIYPLWPAELRVPGLSRAHSQSPILVENSAFLVTNLFNIQCLGRDYP